MQQDSRVLFSTDDQGVARVTLNRPDKHNAFDDDMIATLHECFDTLHEDSAVRAVVLQSTGKSFSAGADLAWMERMAAYSYDENLRDASALAEMLQRLRTLPQPTLARIQGNAFGGAIGLISCCDIAIAAEGSRFGLTESRIGLIPATIAPHVIDAIGTRWARRLFQTAERIDSKLALRIDLIHEVCHADALDMHISTLLTELHRNSPQAMRDAKRLVQDFAYRSIDASVMEDSSARIAKIRVSPEGQEGLQAFLEKRSPAWVDGGQT